MQFSTKLTIHDLLLSSTSSTINTFLQSNPHYRVFNQTNRNNTTSVQIKETAQLTNLALGIFLSLFCFITVFGNGLVIYAIVQERYLKSATYYYMASLACADLIVGLIVIPFAIVQVIYGDYWPFGDTCCDLWHSIDVCASTASILDLCVIALDRYSAIRNPISYHRTFFVKRWPYLLAAVWLCSGLISFPAIAYWRLSPRQYEVHRCHFSDDVYYVVFSSLISFYIPLFVMIFVYIRIYRTAIKQLHAFKTGVKVASPTTKKKKKGVKDEDTPLNAPPDICLRIHRGKYHGIPSSARESSSIINPPEPMRLSSPDERSTLSVNKSSVQMKKSISGAFLSDHQNSSLSRFSMPTLTAPSTSTTTTTTDNHQLNIINSNTKRVPSQETISTYNAARTSKTNPTVGTGTSIGKRLTKFSKEQKATITLAYVMGIFVLCWLPFFVYNPLTAMAKLVIQRKKDLTSMEKILTGSEVVFQMFTWFGYINSSVNPIIYAYSSREFRRAFIKYLCRCFPMRVRNLMMSYHNLHLLRYRRTPESNVSKENNESGSDHNHHVANHINPNKQHMVPPSSTTILSSIKNKTPHQSYKHPRSIQTKHSRLWFLTNCCRTKTEQQHEEKDKHSTANVSTKVAATAAVVNNTLVDYCTYHDVAISRVTCV